MTPSNRSRHFLRENGFMTENVEKRLPIPGMHITVDCFGFGDLLVCKPKWGTALVQVTSFSNLRAREKKARALPELKFWLKCGNRFILHGWKRHGAAKEWGVVVREVQLDDTGSKRQTKASRSQVG